MAVSSTNWGNLLLTIKKHLSPHGRSTVLRLREDVKIWLWGESESENQATLVSDNERFRTLLDDKRVAGQCRLHGREWDEKDEDSPS
jgi:hypothetical protein